MNFIAQLIAHHFPTWLLERSFRRPYRHLNGYMYRWWLFNPYEDNDGNKVHRSWLMRHLPSVRLHYILRADNDRHMHDHPWDARTIILIGSYLEERMDGRRYYRIKGDTATLKFGEYHRIQQISDRGVLTLFITFKKRGDWGFWVDGLKVPHQQYLAQEQPNDAA